MPKTFARRSLPPLLLIALLLSGVTARAEDLTELPLEELGQIRVEKLSSASRYEQPASDAPSHVSVITREQIRTFGYRTVGEALNSLSGFFITNDRNYTYLGERGFGRQGDYDTRVLMMIDGHRLNDAVYDSAPLGEDFPVSMDLIDRIEVVRGPSSSIYGANAFFAAVNVITRQPESVNGAEVSAGAARFDTYEGRVAAGGKIADEAALLLSVGGLTSNGQRLFFQDFDSPDSNDGVADPATDAQDISQAFLSGHLGKLVLHAGYGDREKHIPTASYDTIFNDPDSKTTDSKGYADLSYDAELDDHWRLSTRAKLNFDRYRGFYQYEGESGERITNRDTSKGDRAGVESFVSGSPADGHTLVAGMEWRWQYRQDQLNFDSPSDVVYTDDRGDSYNWALFAQDEIRFSQSWVANLGARFDYFDPYGGSVNPRVGLMHHFNELTTGKLLYGRAFRVPSSYETSYSVPTVQAANPSLDSEYIDTFEVVLERALTEHLSFTGAVFHYQIDGLINQIIDPDSGELRFVNGSDVDATGAELVLKGEWTSGWLSQVSYSHSDIDREEGDTLTSSPEHLLKAQLIAPLIERELLLGVELYGMSKRRTLDGAHTAGFGYLNLHLRAPRLFDSWELYFGALNLLDKSYYDPASGEHVQDEIEQDGRVFRVLATYRFQREPEKK